LTFPSKKNKNKKTCYLKMANAQIVETYNI